MGKYSKSALYTGYDKNNVERQKEDYYATPTEEVENILSIINLKFSDNDVILEPCCGGGHMLNGILPYHNGKIIGTDIKDRGYKNDKIELEYGLDFLTEEYPIKNADYIIMNPPFKLIEPFVLHSIYIAEKGILMLARLQFLEGESRYNSVIKDFPPTDVYVYVDRIACYKNGDFSEKQSSAQAYAWFYWDMTKNKPFNTTIHWIRRHDKK